MWPGITECFMSTSVAVPGFPRRGHQPPRWGCQPILWWSNCSWKMHESERNWTRRERSWCFLDPPMYNNYTVLVVKQIIYRKFNPQISFCCLYKMGKKAIISRIQWNITTKNYSIILPFHFLKKVLELQTMTIYYVILLVNIDFINYDRSFEPWFRKPHNGWLAASPFTSQSPLTSSIQVSEVDSES